MATPMSSAPDAAILLHQPPMDPNLLASTSSRTGRSIEELYDVGSTVDKLLLQAPGEVGYRFRRVALQFPDEILPDAVPIYWALKREVQRRFKELVSEEQGGADGEQEALPDFYVLADTSYGNCCVDEVAAQHVEADVVVHYGHTCLSPTARLPVIYVFPKQAVQVESAAAALALTAMHTLEQEVEKNIQAILFSYDVGYLHLAQAVFDRLQVELQQANSSSSKQRIPPMVMTQLDTERNFEGRLRGTNSNCRPAGQFAHHQGGCTEVSCPCKLSGTNVSSDRCCLSGSLLPPPAHQANATTLAGTDGSGRLYHLPPGCTLSDTLICYLGGESLALTNLLLRAGPSTPVISYDPFNSSRGARREDGKTNRLLMRRYAAVQKARDASVIGLLVGTLGVQSYLPLLAHLRQLLTGRRPGEAKSTTTSRHGRGGRKVYTISVGKLSPAKLANFQEVELFVLLACPENSLVDAVDPTGLRSKDFYRPIVTPFEMILALDEGRIWTGEYVLEMERLVGRGGDEDGGEDAGGEGGEETERDRYRSSDDGEDGDRPHFSLVTGGYVSRRRFGHEDTDEDSTEASRNASLAHTGAVVVRSSNGEVTRVLDSASAMHLATRSWKGLEQRLGMEEPAPLEEGREGIARGYRDADGARRGDEAR